MVGSPIIICSDASVGQAAAAAACIVRVPAEPGKKIVATIAAADSFGAELAGGILGLAYLNSRGDVSSARPQVIWHCDHEQLRSAVAASNGSRMDAPPGPVFWQAFFEFASGMEVSVLPVPAGARRSRAAADHLRCHRVCGWVCRLAAAGRLGGAGSIGRAARHEPRAAWQLIDWRGGIDTNCFG